MEFSHEFDVEGFKRVSGGLNKIDTRMNTIINNIRPVRFILCLKIRIKSRFNTFQNGFPTKKKTSINSFYDRIYLSSLLTKSPNPGVSTTLSLNRTPFSSISALIALILTVCGTSTEVGPLPLRGAYKLALNKVFTSVDFPNPDSPRIPLEERTKGVCTNDHDIEIESLSNGLTMPLIR